MSEVDVDDVVEGVEELDEELEDEGEDTDEGLDDAQKAYIGRMKALGAQYDDANNFLGWSTPQAVQVADDDEEDDIEAELNRRDAKLRSESRPGTVAAVVADVVGKNPNFGPYADQVKAALLADPNIVITPQAVESTFYYFRGMGADLEVAQKVTAKKTKTNTKIAAGAAAASEAGSTQVKPKTKNAEITDLIAKQAKAWGLNAQELANELQAKKGGK
jgi:hypothetical protein